MRSKWLVIAPILSVISVLALASPALELPKDIEIGVYLTRGSEWREALPETVNWKSGNIAKRIAPDGIVKENLTGKIAGRLSSIAFTADSKIEALIHTDEGASADGYRLLRLHPHSDSREVRSEASDIFNFADRAARDVVPFRAELAGSRVWRVELSNLQEGQYGFIPPLNSGDQATAGRMYTFDVVCEKCDAARTNGKFSKIVSGNSIRKLFDSPKDPIFRF